MSNNQQAYASAQVRERTILRNVYLWMSGGLALSGIVALMVANSPALLQAVAQFFLLLVIGEFALVWFLSARIQNMSPGGAALAFSGYAGLNGLTLGLIIAAYVYGSPSGAAVVAQTFFVTAGTFAAVSVWAMTTPRSLVGMGRYLMMGLIGLIIASVVNIFFASGWLDWIISYAGVAIFIGLTAYDTQMIAGWSRELTGNVSEGDYVRISIQGALKLYLDFVNLFLFMLRIFGRRN